MRIPSHRPTVGEPELDALREVFRSGWLGMGGVARELERRLAERLGAKHVLVTATGTAALHLAFDAIGLGPGDDVLLPSLTFVATPQAIRAVGARPVFCDVREETLCLDPDDARRRLTPRTRAIVPVHYAGLACEMDELLALARSAGLTVVEDAAHAIGSTYRGRPVGTLGHVTCFSFDPIKNFTCGNGGAIATDDDAVARRVKLRRNLGIDRDSHARHTESVGREWYYEVAEPGWRYHMPDLNAAIGLAQLPRLDAFVARKREIVARYDAAFAGHPGLALVRRDLAETAPFSYVVRVLHRRRDGLVRALAARSIGCAVQFVPNHFQPLFAEEAPRLAVTERVAAEIVSLPLYVEMTDADVEEVIDAVRSHLGGTP